MNGRPSTTRAPTDRIPEEILQSVFGFDAFRDLQAEIISRVLGGGDALVVMPTGSGKSLCFQIPAMLRSGTGVVVSPLIALMDDQVISLEQLGVAAASLHSNLDDDETRAVWRGLEEGRLDLLYVSPERLLVDGFLDRLAELGVALFAIGALRRHDFRPEYLELPGAFPTCPASR